RIAELKTKNLTAGARAVYALRITKDTESRAVRKGIAIYAKVARDSHCSEMLSKPRLDEFRERIMTTVSPTISALKLRIENELVAIGWPKSTWPNDLRYAHLHANILEIVNIELRVLEAEGKAWAHPAGIGYSPEPVPEQTQPDSKRTERPTTIAIVEGVGDDPEGAAGKTGGPKGKRDGPIARER